MTPENLRALIAAGETSAVEFKGEEREPLNDRDLVKPSSFLPIVVVFLKACVWTICW